MTFGSHKANDCPTLVKHPTAALSNIADEKEEEQEEVVSTSPSVTVKLRPAHISSVSVELFASYQNNGQPPKHANHAVAIRFTAESTISPVMINQVEVDGAGPVQRLLRSGTIDHIRDFRSGLRQYDPSVLYHIEIEFDGARSGLGLGMFADRECSKLSAICSRQSAR
jgi:hypothetical protein